MAPHRTSHFRLKLLVLIALLLCIAPTVEASSVSYSTYIPEILSDKVNSFTGDWYWWDRNVAAEYSALLDTQVTVSYHARVVNSDTGEVLQCSSVSPAVVPDGTHLRFEFTPHSYTDISWFAAGAYFDSPYGDWLDNAARPYSSMCASIADKDYVDTYTTTAVIPPYSQLTAKIYSSLMVHLPSEWLSGLNDLQCTTLGDGVSMDCVADSEGSIGSEFHFWNTFGKFYSRTYVPKHPVTGYPACYTSNEAALIRTSQTTWGGTYILDVPEQTIPCPIVVVAATGNKPTKPTVTSTACYIGSPVSLSFSSTDPGGHKLKYGIDWDADGTIDQFAPSSGYVNSGTIQTASRTYSIAGQKTVKVIAINDQGASSPWATYSPSTCACPSGYVQQGNQCVLSSMCNKPPRCSGNHPELQLWLPLGRLHRRRAAFGYAQSNPVARSLRRHHRRLLVIAEHRLLLRERSQRRLMGRHVFIRPDLRSHTRPDHLQPPLRRSRRFESLVHRQDRDGQSHPAVQREVIPTAAIGPAKT